MLLEQEEAKEDTHKRLLPAALALAFLFSQRFVEKRRRTDAKNFVHSNFNKDKNTQRSFEKAGQIII